MEPTAKGALLWSRAALVAFVALVTGALGHVSADGLLPSPLVLAGVFALSVPCCAAQLVRPVLLPFFGWSLLVLALDQLVLRRVPAAARFFESA